MSFTEGAIYYADGDTLTTGTFYLGGCLTDSKTEVCFSVPLNKPVRASDVSITSATLRVRQNGSYILGDSSNGASISSSQISSVALQETFISVILQDSSAFSSGTNNDAVCVSGTITFKFS